MRGTSIERVAKVERMRQRAEALWNSGQPVVLMGDWNVVPTDADIYKPDTWRDNALLQPAPREAYAAIEAHLRAHAPFGAQLSFSDQDYGDAFLVDTSGWAVEQALDAMNEAYGVEPVQIGVGGSIPFIAEFLNAFPQASVLVTGVEDPDTRAHGANEGLHLAEFEKVVLAEALLLRNLGEL